MSFLAPFWLALASAVAVPVLLHLLRRRIGTRVEFPAARYLARAERENSRKLRLRNLVLMALRALAVLLVALAAARPVARVIGTGHAPTALALVVDNSLSTATVVNGVPVFEGLRRAAREVLDRATGADRVWLVTADGRVAGGSVGAVRASLDRLQPMGGRGDLAAALTRAAGLVRGAGLAAGAVALATDGQATTWRAPVSIGDVPVSVLLPAGTPPPNHAVVAAAPQPDRWSPRGAVIARTAGADSSVYRVILAGRTLARGTTTGDAEIAVRASPSETGWVSGAVELEPDELRGDDARHFAVWIGPAPGVAVDPGTGPFVRSAVDALVQGERVRAGADVAIVTADALTRLPALVTPPADPIRLGAANRALERAGIPWRFAAPRREAAAVRPVGTDSTMLTGVTAAMRYPLVPSGGGAPADTVATAAGEPWIVAGARYVIVGTPLAPEATNFPVRAGFIPWLADAVTRRLVGDVAEVVAAAPGATYRPPPGARVLEAADGTELPVDARAAVAPDHPGVYFFRRGAARAGALVVNAEPDESALARLPAAELRDRIRGAQVAVEADAGRWAQRAFTSGARRPLGVPLLAAALVLLLVETLVAGGVRAPTFARATA